MPIFYFFIVHSVVLFTIWLWYALLRRKMKEHVLLPAEVTRCTFKKIAVEVANLKQQGMDDRYTRDLKIVEKLYVASWAAIALGPLGLIWVLAFS